nr:putative ribonuclease H-like domain-containing protein [Tanacetum cinerariifolium]
MKGIKRKFSVPRTPQQNGIAKWKNKTLIEAARTMLADSLLPIPFWAEAVNTACYVQNRNTDGDTAFEVKEPEFEGRKPESEVHVSSSSSAQSTKHDDKMKREAKGTIPAIRKISTNSTTTFSAAGSSNTAVTPTLEKYSYVDTSQYHDDPNMLELEDITYFDDEEDVGAEADFTNSETTITVSPIPTTRVHKDHHVTQIIGDLSAATQTRSMTKVAKDQGGLPQINNDNFHTHGKRAIGTKWVFKNNKDERGIVVRNKARLVAQGHTQEEGTNYEKVFTQVERIEAIRLFLAYASFIGFMVYQIDVKSAFLYGTIEEEVYVCQPPGFEDPDYPDKIYVDDIIFGSTNKDLCKAFEKLMKDKFQMSSMGELTFFLDGKSASTPIDIEKPLLKDLDVCACAHFQVTPKASYLHAVKRVFRYLKVKPHLGLWYPKDSPFNLVAYSDSDYVGASLDRKSTTGGCQFLGCRLISWQCKKQTVFATSSTEVEYVAAATYCAQVLWIQNQLLDYGANENW